MRIDVLTLFPEVIRPYASASILGRAQQSGIADVYAHQLRDFSTDPHQKVDDRPFGGGPGMVLMCQSVCDAVAAVEALDERPARRILFTPQGARLTHALARRYADLPRLLLICGHYEGYDERIIDILQPDELSLGDFILTGGEPAALALMDCVVRLLPGALGHERGALDESFERGVLEHPHYTRPRDFRGHAVPAVLLSGDHAAIEAWRRAQAEARTRQRRPDLLGSADVPCGDVRRMARDDGARHRSPAARYPETDLRPAPDGRPNPIESETVS
jgi:tRNA (guanine37-N1)-methyltransferase